MPRRWPLGHTLLVVALLAGTTTLAQDLTVDTDGDALPDVWETQGVRVPVNGQEVFVDLPGMGASPTHKDLFVEADYMMDGAHSHKPNDKALEQVITAFANAPVSNPDGVRGITIHIDAGPDTVMDPRPGRGTLWRGLSQANPLKEEEFLLPAGDDLNPPQQAALQSIKAANFNAARAKIFRYCIFAHHLGLDRSPQGKGGSGIATGIPSLDFIVTLGGWTDNVGSVPEQGGTFMHELGHAVGLRHGGSDDIHRKPNYLSIMNYLFQTRGLRVNGADFLLDFSQVQLSDLNEGALNEAAGIGTPSAFGTRWESDNGSMVFLSNTSSPIDWNQNNTLDPPYSRDVNFDGTIGVLTGFSDWSAIQFAPVGPGTARAAHVVRVAPSQELTKIQDDQIPTEFEVSVDIEDEIEEIVPGDFVEYPVTITNLGLHADTYRVTATSSLGWADFFDLPEEVTLEPGEAASFILAVDVPEDAPAGRTEESNILVTSVRSPLLTDQVEALTEAAGAGGCAGDCNADDEVTIEELIKLVNISLGSEATSACAPADTNGDDTITIEEIIGAVANALNQCPAALAG